MFGQAVFYLLLLVHLVSGHFEVVYPYWRGNSFQAPNSQWNYPCAGINQTTSADNRTIWPLTGGSLVLDLHHPWTYVFVNLGLGSNVTTNFNISLFSLPLNETGNGTLCLSRVSIPTGLATDGMNASLQVVTSGESGSALYNCADITFSSAASSLSGNQCANSTGVNASFLKQASDQTPTAKSGGEESFGKPLWVTYGLVGVLALSMSVLV